MAGSSYQNTTGCAALAPVHLYPIMGKGANSMGVPTFEDTAKRVHNFSAGPACLPESVMRTAAAEFCDLGGSGIGMMEMSHRDLGGPVQNAMSQAAAELRSLLSVPDSYHVLFMQGGAHGQVRGQDFLGSKPGGAGATWAQRRHSLDCTTREVLVSWPVSGWARFGLGERSAGVVACVLLCRLFLTPVYAFWVFWSVVYVWLVATFCTSLTLDTTWYHSLRRCH